MKKLTGILMCFAVIISMFSGCSGLDEVEPAESQFKIALIDMNHEDADLQAGAMKAAEELTAEVVSMAADGVDAAQQIRNAVSSGYQALVVAAENADEVALALEEAAAAGVKIVYVNASEENAGETVFATDNEAAGKEVGEFMLKALKDRGITSGVIGVIGKNSEASLLLENGFRSVFETEPYTLMNTLTDEDDAEKFAFVAGNYIDNGAAALFCCNEDATVGAGQAMKIARTDAVVVGFGQSEDVKHLVDEGIIHAIVEQNFELMGYEGVKAAVAAVKGDALNGGLTDLGISIVEAEIPAIDVLLAGDLKDRKIALIAMDRIDRQWKNLEDGAMRAAEELGCEVINLSPDFSDEAEQAGQIYYAIEQEADAVVIAAHHSEAVYAALKDAIKAGIRVVCVDTPADVEAEASYVTDSKSAGRIAGEIMLAELKAQKVAGGAIGILGTSAEDEAGLQLEEGFREALEGTAYTLLETQYTEADAALSHSIAYNCIDQTAAGIFCCSEGALIGTANAVNDSGKDVIVVGYGISEKIWEMVEAGKIFASVSKDTERMGYEAVRAACAALKGGKLGGEIIDTGSYILKK